MYCSSSFLLQFFDCSCIRSNAYTTKNSQQVTTGFTRILENMQLSRNINWDYGYPIFFQEFLDVMCIIMTVFYTHNYTFLVHARINNNLIFRKILELIL